jgi:two-component system, sensor histidine kinase and response regulator
MESNGIIIDSKQGVRLMTSYEKRALLLELLIRNSSLSLPELVEDPEYLEDLTQEVFDDLKKSRQELRAQVSALQTRNRRLEEYVHMVAHDLKEPLVVMAFTSNLITNMPDLSGEKLKEYLRQMGQTANEMKRIINNLKHFSKVSEAEAPFETVQMSDVVANVQGRLSHLIREQQAQVVIPETWPDAIGYGPWIEEVWANYLSNAIKYGGQPPYVELGASARAEGVVHFWVRDNGPGIPPAVRTHLFTAFNHVGHLHHLEHGLGLSIVLQIVDKLGGQVGVESEPGMGSLFYFTLPADASARKRSSVSPYAKQSDPISDLSRSI